jgi:hypothetical protein
MWFLFHRKEGTKAVAGGRSFVEECPTCKRDTRFDEIEVSESYGVWFVDLIGDKERAFKCRECGDTFDLRDEAPARTATRSAPPAKTGMDRVEALAAEQRRRDGAAQAQRLQIEARLDDELAELKKRMGKT